MSTLEARFLFKYWKITIMCYYSKVRYLIFILNVIEKIYTPWIRYCEERDILSTPCFSWDSRIPINAFRYFSTIKRAHYLIDKKQAFHPFVDISKKEINRCGTTGESYSVSSTILRSRKAVCYHREFRWFSSWIIDRDDQNCHNSTPNRE